MGVPSKMNFVPDTTTSGPPIVVRDAGACHDRMPDTGKSIRRMRIGTAAATATYAASAMGIDVDMICTEVIPRANAS